MASASDLSRFELAQSNAYESALAELRAGRKRSHWMWFVFPQLRGLGRSSMADFYGLAGLNEARAYLAHPLLGTRLKDATSAVLTHSDLSAHTIFGTPDDLKFHSSMTLFALAAADGEPIFNEALDAFFSGAQDEGTLRLLQRA
ncbi:DUF1810 domain-containing protein [Tianweitania sp. BSSL-BM11]|uniref:DUF1810 domain-containing protein n=1 Tax=Tianweitania aestuarii TaxID=2814886 RepID=A0ABS5RYW6_9HYPH|nr:DUF1810 domain-containing protein [Tianweitania aestuarii]MBS9722218.1 DUF1810 domain-containing protein [Tianweitania aestuarii]